MFFQYLQISQLMTVKVILETECTFVAQKSFDWSTTHTIAYTGIQYSTELGLDVVMFHCTV